MTSKPSLSSDAGRSPDAAEEPRSRDKKREHRPSSGGGGDGRRQRHRAATAPGGSGGGPPCANAHALRSLDARFSLHLHPSRAGDALAGAREALAAQLLRHSADLGGVLLAVAGERLVPADDDGGEGNGAPSSSPLAHAPPPAPLHPYHPYLRVVAAARALVFRLPPRGGPLVGFVTKVGRDYVALLVAGCLAAAVGSAGIRSDFKFRAAGLGPAATGAAVASADDGSGGKKEGEAREKGEKEEEGQDGRRPGGDEAAAGEGEGAAARPPTPAAWVSRRDPTHVLTVGTEVRFEVAGSVSAGGLYSILGALRQPWTGAISHVGDVPVESPKSGGGGGGGKKAGDGGGDDPEAAEEAERRRRRNREEHDKGSGKDDKGKVLKEGASKEKKKEKKKKA